MSSYSILQTKTPLGIFDSDNVTGLRDEGASEKGWFCLSSYFYGLHSAALRFADNHAGLLRWFYAAHLQLWVVLEEEESSQSAPTPTAAPLSKRRTQARRLFGSHLLDVITKQLVLLFIQVADHGLLLQEVVAELLAQAERQHVVSEGAKLPKSDVLVKP